MTVGLYDGLEIWQLMTIGEGGSFQKNQSQYDVVYVPREGFIFPMVSLGTPLESGEGMKPSPLVELNPNMLVRDVERMHYMTTLSCTICPFASCTIWPLYPVLYDHLHPVLYVHLHHVLPGHLHPILCDHLYAVLSDHLHTLLADYFHCVLPDHLHP